MIDANLSAYQKGNTLVTAFNFTSELGNEFEDEVETDMLQEEAEKLLQHKEKVLVQVKKKSDRLSTVNLRQGKTGNQIKYFLTNMINLLSCNK